MKVRVGFSRGTTWIARLICFVTGSDISHSFFLVQSEAGEWVYEAHPRGFRRQIWEEYQRENTVKGLVEMDWPHVEVKRALDDMVGMKYPLAPFFVMGVLILFRRAARRPTRFLSDGVDCVTSVVRLAKEYAKIDLGTVTTPDELQKKIRRRE